VQLVDKGKVTALMTAESIIVAFLVTYGATVNNTLVSLTKSGEPIFGTVLAGFLISALAITAFQSIYLLYRSIAINIFDLKDLRYTDERYKAGYDLFLMVIAGSGFYVVMNAFSILHYAMIRANVPDTEPLYTSIAGSFLVAWLLLVVFIPLELTGFIRSTRRTIGNCLFAFLVVFLICVMIEVEVVILPLMSRFWSSYLWSVVFAAFTIAVVVWITCGRRKRDKTEKARDNLHKWWRGNDKTRYTEPRGCSNDLS
jgi:hypothetical protein